MDKKPTLTDAWLDSEMESLIRDFGIHRILHSLARAQEPNVKEHGDDILLAYTMLDKENGGHNVINLAHLRRCVTLARKDFDNALYKLVAGNKVCLVPTNPCYKLDNEEMEAQFKHGQFRWLFISRVLIPRLIKRPDEIHDKEPEKREALTTQQEVELALKS